MRRSFSFRGAPTGHGDVDGMRRRVGVRVRDVGSLSGLDGTGEELSGRVLD